MDHDDGKKWHIETVDFLGNKVFCTERRWKRHICRKPHEYMDGEEQEVMDTLKRPDYRIRHFDADEPCRRIYYMSRPAKNRFVKVVVEFPDVACLGVGEIVTAYETNNIKDGEKPELKP